MTTFPVPGSNFSYTRSYFVYKPSGDASGEKDANAINGLLAQGKGVLLQPGGGYFINQPINQWQTSSYLSGLQWWSASPADQYGAGIGGVGGAMLQVTTDFPDGEFAFDLVNSTGGQQNYGVDINGVNLYGWNIPDTTPNAGLMRVQGAWGASFLRGAGLIGSTGDTLSWLADDTTGKVPDDWQVTDVKVSGSLNGRGIAGDDTPDFWWDNVESSEHKLNCWDLNFGTNSRLSNCKGENSLQGNNWHFGGLGDGNIVTLANCSSQFAWLDGILFDNAAGDGTGLGTYVLNGFASTHDNQANDGWASYDIEGCLALVMGSGCVGQGAAYGVFQAAASYGTCFTASSFTGTTAATHDDGTNTHALVNQSPVPF